MERILFVVPPYVSFDSFVKPAFNERTVKKKSGVFGSVVTDVPLGLLSISSYIKKYASVEVRILDFNIILNKLDDFKYNSFAEMFLDFFKRKEWTECAPSVVGISALFVPAYRSTVEIAQVVRRIFPKTLITAGGGVPANMYEKLFAETSCFDALCYGEGEKPFFDLIKAKNKKQLLRNHSAWITKRTIGNKKKLKFDFVEDLDEIPFLDYDSLNLNDYRLNPILSLFPLEHERHKKGMSVMTSRGCPHHCCFCSSHSIHGRRMRFYSLKRIKADFKKLKEQYGAETLIIFDDQFMADKNRVFKILDILYDLKLTAFFPNSLALYALDKKMLKALKRVGVNNLVLSVESGSDRVLKEIMHKPLTLEIVKRVIDDCRKLDIVTDLSVMIGLPGETKQDIEDARRFFKTLKPSWFRFSMATPLVGSEMFDICQKNNYFQGDYLKCDFKRPIIKTKDFTPAYIQKIAYDLNLELNFVENSDYKLGNYDVALKELENTIKVKDDHAFAYYYAAKCCKKIGLIDRYLRYKQRYFEIINKSKFWKNYAVKYNLETDDRM